MTEEKISRVYWPAAGILENPRFREELARRKRFTAIHWKGLRAQGAKWTQSDYFPLQHLAEGLSTFEFAFDVASIFHTTLACELAVLLRVTSRIERGQAQRIYSPRELREFKSLIRISKAEAIMDEVTAGKAEEIRLMRNLYVHYYNAVYLGYKASFSVPPLPADYLDGLTKQDGLRVAPDGFNTEAAKSKLRESQLQIEKLRPANIENLIDPDLDAFFQRRAGEDLRRIFKTLVDSEKFTVADIIELYLRIGRDGLAGQAGFFKLDRKMIDAQDAISWATELFRALGILKSD